MTKRRDFIRKSALTSAGITLGNMGFNSGIDKPTQPRSILIKVSGKEHLGQQEIKNKITEALNSVAVIDPHCHLDGSRPAARSLADIILYHHVWIELVSAGMGQNEVTVAGLPHELADPQMEPVERVRKAMPYLPRIRNTMVGTLLNWLLSDLYGVKNGLQAEGIDKLASEVERRGSNAEWPERLFKEICGIERAITVERMGEKPFTRIAGADERFRKLNIADGKASPRQLLQAMSGMIGKDVKNASDYQEFAAKLATDPSLGSPTFIGAWMPGFLTDELAVESEVTRIIEKAWDGKPLSEAEMGSVSYFGMIAALEALRSTPVRTIQLIAGAEVIPPHRSLTQWSGRFCGSAGRLASRFEDFRFNISAASDAFTQDIAIMAKHIPNVSVAGYWWHTLYPFYIRKSIETRLDIVPASKIVAFFSDAYHCEWCWPKLRLVKQIMGEALIDRINNGMYDLDTALTIIPMVFHHAPKEIYRL